MKQVKTIQFSARVTGGHADALATVTFTDGTTEKFEDQSAMAGMLTFVFGYALPQMDDARGVVRDIPRLTGKPLPEWITP